jgi:hypothetical protein
MDNPRSKTNLIQKPDEKRNFESPVAWLLGRQLLRSLKGILLYTAYGKKLDPRDWMRAKVFPSKDKAEALKAWRLRDFNLEQPMAFPKAPLPPGSETDEANQWKAKGEFWFDYISDTGDGMKATYSIAYLCLGDLYVKSKDPQMLKAGDVINTIATKDASTTETLPRGEFLLIGGDTAYHASDYITLASRVQLPFKWAYKDLNKDGGAGEGELNRPLFGIPGNHDYYDQLDGFRRQFRHKVRDEPLYSCPPENVSPEEMLKQPQLFIRGFNRHQQASYFALRLPFDWWLWGLDTEVGQIDERQAKFFRDLCDDDQAYPPKKLIVATCAPTTVFGKFASPDDGKAADAFLQLGLSQPFLPKKTEDGANDNLSTAGDEKLEAGQCRLDISGDVHHYARYWGPNENATTRAGEKDSGPSAKSYASIVSGIGGAFHHPSETYVGDLQEQSLYPSEEVSTTEVARKIFKFWNIWAGGYVWLAGLIIAFTVYFSSVTPQSSKQAVNNFPLMQWLRLAPPEGEIISPTAIPLPPKDAPLPETSMYQDSIDKAIGDQARQPITPFWDRVRGYLGLSTGPPWSATITCDRNPYLYFYGPCPVQWPQDLKTGALLLLLSLVSLAAAAAALSTQLFEKAKKWLSDKALWRRVEARAKIVAQETGMEGASDRWVLQVVTAKLMIAISASMLIVGLAMIWPYRAHITPFESSMLILYSIVWAAAAIALSLYYSDFLFKKAHLKTVPWYDWWLTWALTILSLTSVTLSIWGFGQNNLPAYFISDMLFAVVLLGTLLGLILLPIAAGGHLLQSRKKSARRGKPTILAGRFLIGLWHAMLQIATPFLLVRKGTWWTWIVAAALILLMSFVSNRLLESKYKRWLLPPVWIIYGALMLAIPYLVPGRLGGNEVVFGDEWSGWRGLAPALVAGLWGAVMSCVWFGWYLAVCFAFNGHNNEVGGACRIERFKQFIRFRLTENGLTGYVIAIDDPQKQGRLLEPRIVDLFTLEVKPGG